VGGVRGRAGARSGRITFFRSLACRSGGRHPGHRDGGALRGAPSERVTSVGPSCCRGHPPTAEGAPTTADVRRSPRRGTPSRMRSKHMHPAQAREIDCLRLRRRVLRSVLRPVRVDPHYARSAQKRRSRGEAFGSVSRLGKPTRVGGTSTGAERTGARGSPRATAPARERAWRVRKGRRSRPPSLRGLQSPGLVARTSCFVAEVGRRRRTSNKLGKRAPKRAVRVE